MANLALVCISHIHFIIYSKYCDSLHHSPLQNNSPNAFLFWDAMNMANVTSRVHVLHHKHCDSLLICAKQFSEFLSCTGDRTNRYQPTLLPQKGLIGGACGPSHTIIFGVDGSCFSSGLNDCGQLGISRNAGSTEFKRIEVPEVTDASCGSNFSAIVTT